ncbi:MAG: guanylate kinase [Blastocatellia bacterium]|nr:guanylate kinase [Blastocatellia bacterium]
MVAGKLIIISSPSGGGKGTLIKEVRGLLPDLGYSCSHTTRPKRFGEEEGREYYFISPDEFERRIEAGEFLEYANVHGNYYGTSLAESRKVFNTGRDLIVEVDVQGALQIMDKPEIEPISIFILPPSFEVLRARLTARATEDADELRTRLRNSFNEVMQYSKFDYVIVNEDLSTATRQMASIIIASRQQRDRQESAVRGILDSFDASRHLFEGE